MSKNLGLKDIKSFQKKIRLKNKKITLCHGVFDLIHIGHLKHFLSSKKFGDILVVSITPDRYVGKGPGRPIFNEKLRSEFLQNIECIDHVIINDKPTSVNLIRTLKPHFYSKGPDYKKNKNDITGEIKNEINALSSYGGKIKYTNDLTSSSSQIINQHYSQFSINLKKNIKQIKNKKINLNNLINSSKKLKVLVLGEIIIDHYYFCETLGKSGKDPVLQMHEQLEELYLGGAAAIAGNVKKFASDVTLMSMIGSDKKYLNFIKKKIDKNIKLNLIFKENSPTIIKKKYLDIITNNKVFGTYIINDSPLNKKNELKLKTFLNKNLSKFDLVIVSDYGHGFISKENALLISKKSNFLALNAQINAANRGFHTMEKYKNLECVIINETELRHELRDKNSEIRILMNKLSRRININDLVVTQGSEGAILYNKITRKYFDVEAFASKVVDKIGSGDTMLSVLSIFLKLKCDKKLSLLIGSLAASQSVGSIGNKNLIDSTRLIKAVDHILK
tara:strand:+ start:1731 stop:3245 length:1515 start_codon:yes stop_codon:yes gene_type:complete